MARCDSMWLRMQIIKTHVRKNKLDKLHDHFIHRLSSLSPPIILEP